MNVQHAFGNAILLGSPGFPNFPSIPSRDPLSEASAAHGLARCQVLPGVAHLPWQFVQNTQFSYQAQRLPVIVAPQSDVKVLRSARPGVDAAIARRTWIAGHRAEYAGRWVALDGDVLISAAATAKEAYEKARGAGTLVPHVVFVEANEPLPFAGW